jgi:hypothetical protein
MPETDLPSNGPSVTPHADPFLSVFSVQTVTYKAHWYARLYDLVLKSKNSACGKRENKKGNICVHDFNRPVFEMETNCVSCEVGSKLCVLFM